MSESCAKRQPRPALSGVLGGYLLDRLAQLDARADRLARQAEAKGDVKTALTATRLSVSILAHMAKVALKCPEAAQNWQPPTMERTKGAASTQEQPAGYAPSLVKPVNAHWHRGK